MTQSKVIDDQFGRLTGMHVTRHITARGFRKAAVTQEPIGQNTFGWLLNAAGG
jgi:hypothetical protein